MDEDEIDILSTTPPSSPSASTPKRQLTLESNTPSSSSSSSTSPAKSEAVTSERELIRQRVSTSKRKRPSKRSASPSSPSKSNKKQRTDATTTTSPAATASLSSSALIEKRVEAFIAQQEIRVIHSNEAEYIEAPPSSTSTSTSSTTTTTTTTNTPSTATATATTLQVATDSSASTTTDTHEGSTTGENAARVSTAVIKRMEQITRQQIHNTDGPLRQTISGVASDSNDSHGAFSNGVEERIAILEGYLACVPVAPVVRADVYARLKALEDRVLAIEKALKSPIGSSSNALAYVESLRRQQRRDAAKPGATNSSAIAGSSHITLDLPVAGIVGAAGDSANDDAMELEPTLVKQPWARETAPVQVIRTVTVVGNDAPGVDIDTRIQQLEQSLKAKAADSSTATTTTTTTTTSGAE